MRQTRASLGVALAAALVLVALLSAPAAQARRVSIAIVGDSVQEGYTAADFADDFASIDPRNAGLAPELRRLLASRTGEQPGAGFVPAHPALWRFTGDWLHVGYGFGAAGPFGASGYAAETTDPTGTATIEVAEPEVSVLYWRGPGGGTFRVSAGGRTWRIPTAAARSDGGGETRLDLPTGTRTLTVTGPADGGLVRFTGLLARRPAPRHATQYEVSNLAHAGRRAGEDVTPANRQAFEKLDIDLSLIMSGTTDELTSNLLHSSKELDDYDGGLRLRARVARRTGRCVIVPPAPLPVRRSIQRDYFRVARRVAGEEGCGFAPVLSRVWTSPHASVAGRLTKDGMHPTRAGYRRIAKALVPVIVEALGVKHLDGSR